MCGIVGAVMHEDARRFLLRGLSALEYRGYDSAGLAFADNAGLRRVAVAGRVGKLRRAGNVQGQTGIGHTRWATHGGPSEQNAHPIVSGNVAVVHNGIIENHAALRADLLAAGRTFSSETDTEVVAHLLELALEDGHDILSAMQQTAEKLEGALALAAVVAGQEEIVFLRRGSPLIIGESEIKSESKSVFLASDSQALEGAAVRIAYLEDGDCGLLSSNSVRVINAAGEEVERAWHSLSSSVSVASLGEHRHFMQKEIFEQPFSAAAAVQPYINDKQILLRRFGHGSAESFRRAKSVLILACGTSYHAGMIARYWLHRFGVPCRVEIGSEYRYCADPQANMALAVAVSQSGETADTLSAMRAAKAGGATTVAMTNSPMSAMAREADYIIPAAAGPEIGVAATKSFTSQLVQLLLLSLAIAKARRVLPPAEEEAAVLALRNLPNLMRQALLLEDEIRLWAAEFATSHGALFIGRHTHYPLALEGALKLKEISYLHAEGCAAGELKHGLLALIDSRMPVVGLAPNNELALKTASNLAEVAARGGRLYVLTSGDADFGDARVLRLQDGGEWTSSMIFAVPLQLLAYHTALVKGTDIDKPRNLAKSVTVE